VSILDPLTSTRRPHPGTPVLPAAEVRARLLGLNRPSAPYRILAGEKQEDLAAEWKIADAEWQPLFVRSGIRRVVRILLRIDPARHVVRMTDRVYDVAWEGDVPALLQAHDHLVGARRRLESSQEIAYSEQKAADEVLRYRFETREMREPIGDVVTRCGWSLKAPAFARL
jgi:hypothetical protein